MSQTWAALPLWAQLVWARTPPLSPSSPSRMGRNPVMGPTSIGTTWAASPFWANKFQVSRFSPSSPSFFLPRSEIHRRRRRSKLRRRLHYSRRRVLAASSVSGVNPPPRAPPRLPPPKIQRKPKLQFVIRFATNLSNSQLCARGFSSARRRLRPGDRQPRSGPRRRPA
ncbi:hypothetical protein DAI22_11g063050 [Oryza sativa Japonica Group]|jgi:hypothetical protein|nr:hypothetical protein DAI22_11g063050 [Oryza sativa Japonica Group]